MLTSSPPTSAPGTDKTGMDFRRILPEIRCQSCLSPGWEPTPRGGFSTLLGWAFRPRNFMKNAGSLRRFPDVRGGFSNLLGWAFGPRNFMKNAVSLRRFPDVRGGFSTLLGWAFRPRNFMKNWHHRNGGSDEVGWTVKNSRS